jgi:hypothetical protein
MAIGSNFYGEGDEINNLFRSQANQSINAGYNAADLADPFRNERKGYQNSLRSLMANPGEFSSSPVYKFAYDQGLNALQRKGSVRSGNKLAALMKYGQDAASQLYFPQANLLSTLSGATTGSPAAAGLAVSGAFNRSQDQRQMGTAAGMYGGGGGAKAAGGGGVPWYMQGMPGLDPSAGPMGGGSLPTGGASGGYGVGYGYTPSYDYGGMGGGYTPSSAAGTGYMTSDYGTTNFGGYDGYTPSYGGDYGGGYDVGYDPYGLSGYSDYGDYSGYGWDE